MSVAQPQPRITPRPTASCIAIVAWPRTFLRAVLRLSLHGGEEANRRLPPRATVLNITDPMARMAYIASVCDRPPRPRADKAELESEDEQAVYWGRRALIPLAARAEGGKDRGRHAVHEKLGSGM